MVRDKNHRLTPEGLHWSNVIDAEIEELIREMREDNMSYEDISHLLLLSVSDSIRTIIMDEQVLSDKK